MQAFTARNCHIIIYGSAVYDKGCVTGEVMKATSLTKAQRLDRFFLNSFLFQTLHILTKNVSTYLVLAS